MASETLPVSRKNGSLAIGRHNTVFYFQPGLKEEKKALIYSIGRGFDQWTDRADELDRLPWDVIPVVGCQPELQEMEERWLKSGRPFVYWDRGYLARGGRTWIKRSGPEYFRWHLNGYQMRRVRDGLPEDRFGALRISVRPWRRDNGKRVVVAAPGEHYSKFHRIEHWTEKTARAVRAAGYVPVIRNKLSRVPLDRELLTARCLIAHGSVAAVEAVVLGCPVVVDPCSAAAPVGRTRVEDIGDLAYPDRTDWLRSIAASQFTADEVATGAIWELIED